MARAPLDPSQSLALRQLAHAIDTRFVPDVHRKACEALLRPKTNFGHAGSPGWPRALSPRFQTPKPPSE